MKKFLILQMRPEEAAADSEFRAILRVGGLQEGEVRRLRLEQETPSVDLDAYCGVIAGGSPFDLTTPEARKSRVQQNIEAFYTRLFGQLIPMDFPFLGCCSGNGLLGKYCGAPVTRTFGEPIGPVRLELTPEGENDKLLAGLPASFDALVGHKEACDIVPEGAVLLASSRTCPVQMFRIGENVYATQFHPEADADEFILRVKTYKDYGYFPPEAAGELIEKLGKIQAPEPNKILRRFVDCYRDSA